MPDIALRAFMADLRSHFERIGLRSSGLYQGRKPVTFFAVAPPSLKRHNLKIAILFNHEASRFEAWLAGRNKDVQRRYSALVKKSPWPRCRVPTPGTGVFAILECDLAAASGLEDPEALTNTIEENALAFIRRIEGFLSRSATQ